MNTKSLYLLGGTTVVVAALAALFLRRGESAVEATSAGDKLFPGLAASINETTSIEVERKDGRYTLERSGEAWGLEEKSGYPVDMAAVRKCLIGISELSTAEEKTSDPAQYSKLGVEDPAVEGSTSTLVRVRDGTGKELAALIVGKQRTGKSFSGPKQVYVRKAGEARSWLANGEVDVHEKSTEWLERKILEIKRERIRAVEVRHADGEVVLVDRDKPETNDFTLHDIPEGKELSYPSAPGSLGSALEWLNLEDVVGTGGIDMTQGTTATTRVSCFDGLTITAITKDADGKTYARFEAAYEEPPETAGPPAPAEGAGETEATSGDGEQPAEVEKPAKKSREEVEKEAGELNARLSSWTYVIPPYNKATFQKRKTELLKDKTPPPESAEAPPGGTTPPNETPAPTPEPEIPEPVPPTPPDDGAETPGTPPESKPPGFGSFGTVR